MCVECRQHNAHWEVGMKILWSKSTKLFSLLRWNLTSQYSRTLGAVRLCIVGNPFCIVSINLYSGSLCPAAWMKYCRWVLFLPALNVAIRVVDLTQSFMSSDCMISDWEGSAGNMLRRAGKMATGLWETVFRLVLDSESVP